MISMYTVSFKLLNSDLTVPKEYLKLKVKASSNERATIKAYELAKKHNINVIDIVRTERGK